jgi:transposase
MDSNKYSTQVERLGVVETGRRRRWTDDEKLKIVLESMQTPRAISSTARRYGISRSLLLNWRRSFCTEPEGAAGQRSGFVPAMVVAEPSAGEEFRLGALELRIDSNYSDSKK